MIELENIYLNIESTIKSDLINEIGNQVSKKYNLDFNEIIKAINDRENQISTGLINGFAIPHGKINIDTPIISLFKTIDTINDWKTLDDSKVKIVINLLIPKEGEIDHLKILQKISMKLMDTEFQDKLLSATEADMIVDFFKEGE